MNKQEIIKFLPLESERTIIRQPTMGDLDAIQRAKEERETDLRRWMSWSDDAGMSRAGAENWINLQTEANTHIGLIAIDKKTGEFIMCTGLDGEDDEFRLIKTGYWISKEYEGKGIAFEVMNVVLDFAFNTVRVEQIRMSYYEGNTRSRNLMERLGLTFDCINPKSHKSHLTGELLDVYEYSIKNGKTK